MLVLSNSLIVLIPYRILEICNENFTDIVDMELFLFLSFGDPQSFLFFMLISTCFCAGSGKMFCVTDLFCMGEKKNCFFMLKAPTIFGKYARYDEK